jgi:hypothetical protein
MEKKFSKGKWIHEEVCICAPRSTPMHAFTYPPYPMHFTPTHGLMGSSHGQHVIRPWPAQVTISQGHMMNPPICI